MLRSQFFVLLYETVYILSIKVIIIKHTVFITFTGISVNEKCNIVCCVVPVPDILSISF